MYCNIKPYIVTLKNVKEPFITEIIEIRAVFSLYEIPIYCSLFSTAITLTLPFPAKQSFILRLIMHHLYLEIIYIQV